MSNSTLDAQLDRLEQQLETLAGSLVGGEPDRVRSGSEQFQRFTIELVQTLDAAGRRHLAAPKTLNRIKAIGSGLANVRENLLRQSAYVDRALEVVVPATKHKATYSGNRTYGGPARQSGAFTVLSA